MKIELHQIKIRDLFEGYLDSGDEGVVAYGGKLDVRPKYQREFIYNDKQRDAVINTVMLSFPLNVMYWAVKEDGNYELLDGQQRTVSILQYLSGRFSFDLMYFHNLQQDLQDAILDYELMVYFCTGGDTEKLEWFKTINIAGVKLSDQELRNAVYSGSWLTDAKRYFSKNNCPAKGKGERYWEVKINRQELLELALKWICQRDNCSIEQYMAKHQHDLAADDLWNYYCKVIEWVQGTFINYRAEMKKVDWGWLFLHYGQAHYNVNKLEDEISKLMRDEDVQKKSGIYYYVLNGDERQLNIRQFSNSEKRQKYEEQGGNCPICGLHYRIEEMEADHIKPWSRGGHTILSNCQLLCINCNRKKGNSLL